MSGGFGNILGGLAEAAFKSATHSQSDVSKTGGHEYNSPDNTPQSSQSHVPSFNTQEVLHTAQKHSGESGDSSLFSTALGFLDDNKHKANEPLNEEAVTQAHAKVYNEGDTSGLSANALGGAAALQTLKKFTSGGTGGGSQSDLISLAMAEATKLFDRSGAASGNKQDAVNGAAMTIMKMLFQSKLSGFIGGGNSGGLSGLLNLAQSFAK